MNKCTYCSDNDATQMGPNAGYCSTECKRNHMAYLVRVGQLPIPPQSSPEPVIDGHGAHHEYVSNRGAITCGFMVNGRPACNSKLNQGHRGPYCWRHSQ